MLGLITLSAEFALLFFDASLVSRSHGARAHGRLDVLFILIRTTLTVFCKAFPTVIGVWGVIGLLLGAGSIWFAAVLYWMPFLHHTANRTDAGIAAVFLLGGVTVVLGQLMPGLDAGIVFMIGAPLALLAGIATADWRAKSIFYRPVPELANATEVSLKCRYLLHEVLYGHATDNLRGIGERTASYLSADGISAAAPLLTSAAAAAAAAAAAPSSARGTRDAARSNSSAHTARRDGGPSAGGTGGGRVDVASRGLDGDDAEALLEIARANLPAADATRIEGVYKAGLARFKASSMLHVALARFYATLRHNQ